MDRIWNELSEIRAEQAEDFRVMMTGFQSQKDSTEALQQSVVAVHKSVVAVQESVVAVQESVVAVQESVVAVQESVKALYTSQKEQQESFGRYVKGANARFDLLEEALKIIENRVQGLEHAS